MFLHLSVSHFVHRREGGVWETPPEDTPPPGQTPPQVDTPWADNPPGKHPPADGYCTRSTGMHSCYTCLSFCPQRERGSLFNVSSCLAAWSHVPLGGGALSRVGLVVGSSVKGVGVFVRGGGLCEGGGGVLGERGSVLTWRLLKWVVRILLECILVGYSDGLVLFVLFSVFKIMYSERILLECILVGYSDGLVLFVLVSVFQDNVF